MAGSREGLEGGNDKEKVSVGGRGGQPSQDDVGGGKEGGGWQTVDLSL